MNDQMREEFEASAKARWPNNRGLLLRINHPGIAADGQYDNPVVHHAWWAWQASRESLPATYTAIDMTTAAADGFRDGAASVVVELKRLVLTTDLDMMEHEDGDYLDYEAVVASIIAAGGSVKP